MLLFFPFPCKHENMMAFFHFSINSNPSIFTFMSCPIAPAGYLLHDFHTLQELLRAVMMVVDPRLLVGQSLFK